MPLSPPRVLTRPLLPLLAAASFFTGCSKPEIRVYTAPKDQPDEAAATNTALKTGLPSLTWTLPAEWKDLGADQMSAARFSVPGEASVMITPLPLMSSQEPALVNMWRQMMDQPLLEPEAAAKALSDIEVAGAKGKLFEVSGKRATEDMKIVTAFLHRDDKSWFFKLQGPPAAVDAQRAAYGEFLKSVKFDAAPTPSPAPTPAPAPAAPSAPPQEPAVPGTPPAAWTTQTPGAMQAAKFSVPDKDGAKADVTVSIFPSDTGGALSNVVRWRGQIGMPQAEEAAVMATVKPLPGGPEGSVFVELENAGRALTGAIVPRGGNWYFYKLMGDAPAVAAAREDFLNYCKTGS